MIDEEKTILHNKIIEVFKKNQTSVDDAFQVIIGLFLNFCHEGNYDEKKFNNLVDGLKPIYKRWIVHLEKSG